LLLPLPWREVRYSRARTGFSKRHTTALTADLDEFNTGNEAVVRLRRHRVGAAVRLIKLEGRTEGHARHEQTSRREEGTAFPFQGSTWVLSEASRCNVQVLVQPAVEPDSGAYNCLVSKETMSYLTEVSFFAFGARLALVGEIVERPV
jgi:hypothetical protein